MTVPETYEAPRPTHYAPEDPRLRSVPLATVLSLMPGLGQVYLGYTKHGFINAGVVATLITIMDSNPRGFEPFFGLGMAFFWLYNIVDANRRARILNQRLAGLPPGELPEGLGVSPLGGSIVGGLALIVVGLLAFAHLQLGLPLDWLRTWWPVAVIGFGVYLLLKALRERSAPQE